MTTLVLPDREALRAALDSGLIPAEVQAAPLQFDVDDQGQLLLDPEVEISRADRKRLKDAGVELRRRSLRSGRSLQCFAEALPSEPAPEPTPPLGEVLFLSEGDEGFLRISGELLRLGSEDQRLAFFEDEHGVRRNLTPLVVSKVSAGNKPTDIVLRFENALDPQVCAWLAQLEQDFENNPSLQAEVALFPHYSPGAVPVESLDGEALAPIGPDWVEYDSSFMNVEGYGWPNLDPQVEIPCEL